MTVCIACLAENGKKVVAGTDTMMTYPVGPGVTYQMENNAHDKLRMITEDVAILAAGDVDEGKTIMDSVSILEKDRPIEIIEKIRKSHEKLLKEKQERIVLTPAGVSWDFYLKHQNQLQPATAKDLHDKLQLVSIGCETVVAGYDRSTSSCYVGVVSGVTIYDRTSLGIALAGNGFSIANLFLAKAAYNKSMDEASVKKLVHDAIEDAGHAPGVGGIGKIVSLPA